MDEKLLFLINRHWTYPALDWIMAAASSLEVWLPLLIAAGALLIWRGGVRGRLCLICVGLTLLICENVFVGPLKRSIARPRPYQAMAGVREVDLAHVHPRLRALDRPLLIKMSLPPDAGSPVGRSFPSGHTADNFSVATMLAVLYRRRGWLYFPMAGLIGYSRIYLGNHWPSDVLVTAILAVGLALCLAAIFELAWRRWGAGWAPGWWRQEPSLVNPRSAIWPSAR